MGAPISSLIRGLRAGPGPDSSLILGPDPDRDASRARILPHPRPSNPPSESEQARRTARPLPAGNVPAISRMRPATRAGAVAGSRNHPPNIAPAYGARPACGRGVPSPGNPSSPTVDHPREWPPGFAAWRQPSPKHRRPRKPAAARQIAGRLPAHSFTVTGPGTLRWAAARRPGPGA